MSNSITAQVTVENVRYHKDGFGIISVSVDKVKKGEVKYDKQKLITVKGEMPEPLVGGTYNLTAEFSTHPKYGNQYNIISFYNTIIFNENDDTGKKKFLASLFSPLQIEALYSALNDPYEVLKANDATQLVKVKGCGMKTAAQWIQRFNDNLYKAKIFTELDGYGLTNSIVEKLLKRYKSPELVIEKVQSNPYVLCTEVDGIGWKTADKIALNSGMDEYGIERVSSFIYNYLDNSGVNGCSWVEPDELMGAIIETLGEEIPSNNITETIHSMNNLWWNDEKSKIGLKKYFNIEQKIAEELIRLRDAETHIKYGNWEDSVKRIEHQNGWSFTDEQKLGVQMALENNVVVIHGYSGTGKSSSVMAFLEALRGYSYVQCALSGRASSRMAEITGKEGYTIHRLLGYPCSEEKGGKNGFGYHNDNPLWADIVFVDEISMVDAYLFYFLLRAIPSGAKLVCLGDMGQLESIGCGNIAHDMINSPEIPTIYLSKIHRQAAASAIITESIRIRRGEQIVEKDWAGEKTLGDLQDLTMDCYSDASNTFYKVMQKYSAAMAEDDFDVMETQVLIPIKNRGDACTYNINNTIQELYNPAARKRAEITVFKTGKPVILRVGDKILNTKNNYKTNPPIFNGNIGIVKEIFPEDKEMLVSFLGIGDVWLDKDAINFIELGFAITCHKSQGSEFNHVILGIDFSAYSLLTRELLYTGITRAKKKCDLVAQTGALRFAINKEGVSKKQTHLQDCLHEVAYPKLKF